MPFNGDDLKDLFLNIITKEPNYQHPNLEFYSSEFLDFLKSLLEKNPHARPSARKILKCGWLKKFVPDEF